MSSVDERLTDQFYRWERRGRGWQVFDEPVSPEPPFRPFRGHFLAAQGNLDDGRKPTALNTFVQRLGRRLAGTPSSVASLPPEADEEPGPECLVRAAGIELQTLLPAKLDIRREEFELFLLSLALCHEPITFELLGLPSQISSQFAVHSYDQLLFRQELEAFFPEVVFLVTERSLVKAWGDPSVTPPVIVEFGLGREFMLPLATGKLDPFVGLTGALSELEEKELGLFQVIFRPVRHPWAESVLRAVTDNEGGPFFINAPELVAAAKEKTSRPLYATIVRVAAKAPEDERAWEIVRGLASALGVFAHPNGNELIPLRNDDYPIDLHEEDLLRRQSRRSGMLLNSDELIGFVHLPSAEVRSPKLQRQSLRTKPVPTALVHLEGLLLGHNSHAGQQEPVRLTPEQRVRHCHVIGASGTGKSTLLFNMICQDIASDEGVAVLDPHGDLVDRILGIIPRRRVEDVVLLDPSDEEHSIGFNILSAHSDLEKSLLASDLVSVFERLSASWGDQMASVLTNAILAFLESNQGGTLADLRRFLLEPAFREKFLETVRDPDVVYYWRKGFTQLAGNKSIGPVLTRLETFLSRKPIRLMVSQKANRLDFGDILDNGRIFLAKLSQGTIGRENSYLLGTLLVAKFQQLAMARQSQQAGLRRQFWLYIDEFHNFITPTMAEILSGARKYRIGLILAHQELRQLQRDTEVASAVLSNPYTRICFRVGDDDARRLGDGFAFFEARDLQSLGTGEAICRVERSDFDFNLTILLPEEPDEAAATERRQEIVAASRRKYATPRAEIEAALGTVSEIRRPAVEVTKPAPSESRTATNEIFLLRAHEVLKERIRQTAEALDYTVTPEKLILEGHGQVDLLLQRGDRSIACEISVKNTVEYEVANVRKCLKAEFAHVAVVCADERKLGRIQEAVVTSLSPEQVAKVGFYSPDKFFVHLREWAANETAGDAIEAAKPRKQKIKLFSALTEEERKEREAKMLDGLATAMKRRAG
jgi:hypothetical protein